MDFSTPIYFVGDPHGLTNQVACEIVARAPLPKAVVFLGDFDLEASFHTEVEPLTKAGVEVWWICGNHDTDHQLYYVRLFDNNRLIAFNLHGRVAEIAGVRVAGLGGVFKARVWMPERDTHRKEVLRWQTRSAWLGANRASTRWCDGLPLHLRDAIWPEDYDLLGRERADVLVCHEAPTSHKHGFAAIDVLAETIGASLVVHGHHHVDYEAKIADGKIRVMGVGLAGVRALDGATLRRSVESILGRVGGP